MMEVRSPGGSRPSRHASPAPKSPTFNYQYTVTPTPPIKSPLTRSPGCISAPQVFNFPDPPTKKQSYQSIKSASLPSVPPKSPIAPPKSPIAPPKSPIAPPKSPIGPLKSPIGPPKSPLSGPKSPIAPPKSPTIPKSPSNLKSPKSPKLPKSPRSPRSIRLITASGTGSYPEIHSPSASDNYFNFNLPSPQKHYSHTKIVCQTSLPCGGGPTRQRYVVKTTPSVEYKIHNVDNIECNIRANPFYASSTSVNESDSSTTGTRPNSTPTSTATRCRRSTSDLTDMSDDVTTPCGGGASTSVTSLSRPSSPRRRGSMKGGLAYLASRRGSRDSLASNLSNVSNEDIGPLNFQNTARGRQRRTSNFLELPVPDHIRPRVCSLPEKPYNPRLSDDLYRLRTFSITNKGGVVNCGDSIINRRSRSNTSVNSTASRASNVSGERSTFDGSCCGSGYHTVDSTPLGSPEEREIPKYRVVLLGDSGVGKTALTSQFMTSEYMNTYDASLDDEFGEKTVSILLDAEESEMIFIDHPHIEMSVENSLSTYEPHACVVLYSITSRESFQQAEEILNYLWRERFTQEKSVIVVGNKADLARSRVISSNEGKALAVSRDCKFIETSSGIQHNVDELLVGILKQIRLRESRDRKQQQKSASKRDNHKLHGSKTSLSLNIAREILQKICMNDISKSKSCENLHVL